MRRKNLQAARLGLSHRVERFWRAFGYDRIDDVIVVFDQVSATRPEFRKRWLLHSLKQPLVREDGFTVFAPSEARAGRGGGRLEGHVLLPRRALLQAIGGPGFEYYVDGRNYDEDGTLWDSIRTRKQQQVEPGAWRIELQPLQAARDDLFLVVLLPTGGAEPVHRVRLLENEGRVGAEIAGPRRTSRWWFVPGRHQVEIEVEDQADVRHQHLVADPPGAAARYQARER